MKEWKKIYGFECYAISNEGDVMNGKGVVMKPFLSGAGYLQVSLFRNGTRIKKYVHRLVAETFLEKNSYFVEVNHKDGNKTNNRVENLEWCTKKENMNHSYYTLKNRVKPVRCMETGVVYPSIKEAARQTGIHHTSISLCCDGRQKKTHGFRWEFVKEGVA